MRATAVVELHSGWQLASCPPGSCAEPGRLAGLDWVAAEVPGTAASALRAAGLWRPGDGRDFDAEDWWFRTTFEAPAAGTRRVDLVLDGLATVAEVYLNGARLLQSESMFAAHRIPVSGQLQAVNELAIRFLALAPLLARGRRPRARWRTRLVSERNLRFYRTMLLGRAPGFAPGPAAVGPWKPVRLECHQAVVLDDLRLRARLDADAGHLELGARLDALPGAAPISSATVRLTGPTGVHEAALELDGTAVRGRVEIAGVAPWWPHTHGRPALYDVVVELRSGERELAFAAGRVGFRSLSSAGELEADGIQLRVNGVPVFARGAVWTPLDLAAPGSSPETLRPVLERARAAGMNMLRVPGTACYESRAFYDLCDELGILLWQDFMFANLDYPDRDEAFMGAVRAEAQGLLSEIGGRPSLAVLCGSSEVAQQAAMMGLDPTQTGGPLYEELLPALIAEARVDAVYVPSTPWGGELPFRTDRGVANYYGVGAYLRPLSDARLAGVRFAGECLAFANVPDEEALADLGHPPVHDPRWKAGVPRDAGAGWDFDDVRDHYLPLLYGADPRALRYADPERYLELSRHVSGELMAEVFGELRRPGSPCGGALVLWLTDLVAGAGWGVLDHRHEPKVAYHYLRRALAPRAVWSTDEGLGGIDVHIANDAAEPLSAVLRVSAYADLERPVEEIAQPLELAPHSRHTVGVESMLGRFIDVSFAYRFGPPAQDLVVLSLEAPDGSELLAQAFRFPAGRPAVREPADRLGLSARLQPDGPDALLTVESRRLAYGVRLHVPGFRPDDDAFSVEPGHARRIRLRADGRPGAVPAGHLSALNLAGRLRLAG